MLICLFVYFFVWLCAYLFVCVLIFLFVYFFVWLCAYLFVCVLVRLFVYLFGFYSVHFFLRSFARASRLLGRWCSPLRALSVWV